MKKIFGAASTSPANKKLKNGYTVYDWVTRQNCFPSFWGRTITGENPITEEEMEFLRSKNCKIYFIIRDLTEKAVSSSNGMKDALRAVQAAKDLKIPPRRGIALFAEIKDHWSVNHNWMITFAQIITDNGYIPGFIGNTDSSLNFNFDRQCSHYVNATESAGQYGAIYCATEPKTYETVTNWEPFCPSALEPDEIHLWNCGKTVFDTIEIQHVYARDNSVLDFMF